MSDNMWGDALGDVNELGQEKLTVDQRLKLAEVKALLAIGQELSGIQHRGIDQQGRSVNTDPPVAFGV